MTRVLRYLWAMPATGVGLVLASLALLRGRTAIVNGVVEAHGPILRWALSRLMPGRGGVSAITLGHVVLGCDAVGLESTRLHERVHVNQYERWGPLFLPAYVGASLAACIRGGDYYFDNRFEREARGGKRDSNAGSARDCARAQIRTNGNTWLASRSNIRVNCPSTRCARSGHST